MADAEIALVGTAPAHLHRTPAEIVAAMDAGPVGRHDEGRVERLVVFVDLLQAAGGEVAEQARPGPLRVTAENGIRVAKALRGAERRVYAAQHHFGAAGPKTVGDLECPPRGAGDGRNAHQVRRSGEIQVFHHLVHDADLRAQFRRDQGLQRGHGQRRVTQAPPVNPRRVPLEIILGMDEQDLHVRNSLYRPWLRPTLTRSVREADHLVFVIVAASRQRWKARAGSAVKPLWAVSRHWIPSRPASLRTERATVRLSWLKQEGKGKTSPRRRRMVSPLKRKRSPAR